MSIFVTPRTGVNRETLLVIGLSLIVLAGWLGSRGLSEPDEGRYAEIAREMALQPNWLIPHLNGVPQFQKPPLTFWITAGFIRLFGANEWAVRLTPALAAFGTILLTISAAGTLYGPSCRWKAGLILVSSTGFMLLARILTADMLLTFFITAAVTGVIRYLHGAQKGWLAVFYIAMGLGFLTKGPLGIAIPSITALALQTEQWRNRKPVARLYWGIGLPFALLIGLSWFLALIARHKVLLHYFLDFELFGRIASNTHHRAKPFWFYPAMSLLGLLPWTGFIPLVARDLWHRRSSLSPLRLWLFTGWVVIPYLLLSLAVSKMATYLLPLMPPLSIILARGLEHPNTQDRWRFPARISAWALAILPLLLPTLALSPRIHLPPLRELPAGFWLATISVILSFLLLAHVLRKGLPLRAFLFWMAGTWATLLLALASQADTLIIGGNRSLRALAQQIARLDPNGSAPILVYRARLNGLPFYLKRFVYRSHEMSNVVLPLEGELLQRIVHDEQEAARALRSSPAILIVKEPIYHEAPNLQDWRCVSREGPWLILASPHLAPNASPADCPPRFPSP